MKLTLCFRAECPRCGIFKYVEVHPSENELDWQFRVESDARDELESLGWTDVCIRCSSIASGAV